MAQKLHYYLITFQSPGFTQNANSRVGYVENYVNEVRLEEVKRGLGLSYDAYPTGVFYLGHMTRNTMMGTTPKPFEGKTNEEIFEMIKEIVFEAMEIREKEEERFTLEDIFFDWFEESPDINVEDVIYEIFEEIDEEFETDYLSKWDNAEVELESFTVTNLIEMLR